MMKQAQDKVTRILVIGTMPPPIGGTSISLQLLVDSLGQRVDVQLHTVPTNEIRWQGWRGAGNFIKVIREIISKSASVDVVTLHVGINALPTIGPLVRIICAARRKPLIVRRFGGKGLQELRGLRRILAQWIIDYASLYLVQTRAMLHSALDAGLTQARWFPTSRPAPPGGKRAPEVGAACRHFVFISHLKLSKGIGELIQAAERFDGDVSVDVYGPFFDGLDECLFAGCKRTTYRGTLAPGQVHQALFEYDALVLPTYYPGEGYPGIILEAFSAGRPVITTQWKDIPEIVDETCGILVPPRDSEALYRAMQEMTVNEQSFRSFKTGALARHKEFESGFWADKFVEYCREVRR